MTNQSHDRKMQFLLHTPRFGQHASRHDSIDVVPQQSHVSAHDAQHS